PVVKSSPDNTLPVSDALRSDTSGFKQALAPRPFIFPADHGPHDDFATEWWYFTGNLATETGRRFGYQLTFFRVGLNATPIPRASHWASSQLYMAHFALTDVQGETFHRFERFARALPSLAGAQAQPLRVWLEGWSLASLTESTFPLQLQAQQEEVAIDLRLVEGDKPLVLQGDKGLSQKSSAVGNASYYYSLTRLPTQGEIKIGSERYQVSGESWFDREWSTSALSSSQAGWDWFSLQLDDHTELMFYQLRNKDGTTDPLSSGTLVNPHGEVQTITSAEVLLTPLAYWRSATTGVRYPVQWRLTIPDRGINLTITPLLAQQEMALSVRYWEGAVEVSGEKRGQAIKGRGYLELAGYARE
ncbi:MAG: secreted hydrolase-like protein, partial [Halothiobacillaceae bacterium]